MINSAGKLYIFTQVNSDIFYGFNIFNNDQKNLKLAC